MRNSPMSEKPPWWLRPGESLAMVGASIKAMKEYNRSCRAPQVYEYLMNNASSKVIDIFKQEPRSELGQRFERLEQDPQQEGPAAHRPAAHGVVAQCGDHDWGDPQQEGPTAHRPAAHGVVAQCGDHDRGDPRHQGEPDAHKPAAHGVVVRCSESTEGKTLPKPPNRRAQIHVKWEGPDERKSSFSGRLTATKKRSLGAALAFSRAPTQQPRLTQWGAKHRFKRTQSSPHTLARHMTQNNAKTDG